MINKDDNMVEIYHIKILYDAVREGAIESLKLNEACVHVNEVHYDNLEEAIREMITTLKYSLDTTDLKINELKKEIQSLGKRIRWLKNKRNKTLKMMESLHID